MKKGLSILLPTYNCLCIDLVKALHRQCEPLDIPFEILVADDGSPDRSFVENNKTIEQLSYVRYILHPTNVGRSAIRNLLARASQYEWIIFIDGDLTLDNPHFIARYAEAASLGLVSRCSAATPPTSPVVVGGIAIGGDPHQWKNNLRYRYEKRCEAAHHANRRAERTHQEFRTTNFMVHRDIILQYPFDEHFLHYGYEDVLFGKTLSESNVRITHIDNPILLDDFEDNPTFVSKNEEALRTLFTFQKQLAGYSTLLDCYNRLKAFHLLPIVNLFYKMAGKAIKNNLQHNNPQVFLFNIYKLLYYSSLNKQTEL